MYIRMRFQIFPFSARSELRLSWPLVDYEHVKVYSNKRQLSEIWGPFHKAHDKYQEMNSEQEVQN